MASTIAESILEHLGALVAFPTVSGTENLGLLSWLGDALAARGAAVDIRPGAEAGRGTLVARVGPQAAGGVVLAGHTDVVPPGEGWSSDPWTATVVNGRVVGRGTADMKGFFAAVLAALDGVDSSALRAPVHVVGTYDEEIGCRGIRDVLAELPALLERPSLVIVGEPTLMQPRRASPGKRVYRATVTARETHSSRARDVPSAISAACRIAVRIDELARARTPPPAAVGGAAVPYTLNVGTIAGGRQVNVIADRCELVFEIRYHSSCDPDEVLVRLWEAVEDVRADLAPVGGGVVVDEEISYPPLATGANDPALALVERIADAGRAGTIGFGTEGGLYASALGAPVIVCGPGDIADAHCADEFVTIAQLLRCADVARAVIGAVAG